MIKKVFIYVIIISLTVDGGGQQRSHNLPLAFLVFVEETLETIEDRAAKHEGLSLIHHGHEKHHDGWSANTRNEGTEGEEIALVHGDGERIFRPWPCLTSGGLKER